MMTKYAENTSVPIDRSKAEIEKTLGRYGATSFMFGWSGGNAVIAFEMMDRRIRFNLEIPDRHDDEFVRTPTGKARSPSQAEAAWEQAQRQRWRALCLVIKAKLEAVESGITEFEDEFLAHIVLPDGSTAGSFMRPQIEKAYRDRSMPALLPSSKG